MPVHAIQREKPKWQAPVPTLDADMPPLQLLNDEVRLALNACDGTTSAVNPNR